MMFERWSRSNLTAFILVSIVGIGCSGGSTEPQRYPVTGKVLFKGKPAHYARVSFIPANPAEELTPAGGVVNDVGEFQLLTDKRFVGAEPGEYLVTISWEIPKRPGTDDPEYGPELLPKKYQDPATSGLKVTIEPSKNELPPFDLNP